MNLTRLLSGAAAVLGLTVVAGDATAQYYPRPYPEPYYARPARPLPPPGMADDEFADAPPGVYGAPQQQPYRRDPPVARYPLEQPQQPVDRGYQDRNAYPDRNYSDRSYDSRPLPPPSYDGRSYDNRPPYDGRAPYSEPYDRSATGALPGLAPLDPRDGPISRPPGAVGTPPSDRGATVASLPPDYQPEQGTPKALPDHLRRQEVAYPTNQPAGTIIIDTPNTYLYLVLGNGRALRYGVGVGRDGFTWSGAERIRKMTEWPDWFPPKEMIERQPYLPRFMAGGTQNPLGARALYLGNTLYRIHGTNQPSTIGTFVSSGCIRLLNEDIEDLYGRVQVGSRVVVVASGNAQMLSALPTGSGSPAGKPKPKQVSKPVKPQAKASTGLPPPAPAAKGTAAEPNAQQAKAPEPAKAEPAKSESVKAQEPPKAGADQAATPAPAPAATQQ